MESILDQFELHHPIIGCALIGLATFDGKAIAALCILGGTLELLAAGWANIGAAVAPDAAYATIASSILLIKGADFSSKAISTIVPAAVAIATVGLVTTTLVRMLEVWVAHNADAAAEQGSYSGVSMWHFIGLSFQGLRGAIFAALLLAIPASAIQTALEAIPGWLSGGLAVGGGMVVAVGYAMVINLMATKEVWPFFFLGFALAPISQLTLIAIGVIGVVLALIYLNLEDKAQAGGGSAVAGSGDPIGDILNDY
jgi:PTS system mannose-specific IIC component